MVTRELKLNGDSESKMQLYSFPRFSESCFSSIGNILAAAEHFLGGVGDVEESVLVPALCVDVGDGH